MAAIAEQAGVALDTVYASVGRKPELARLLIETAISGSSQAVPAERDYVRAIQAAPDAETKIAIYASAMLRIAGRPAPVLAILQQSAAAEPELTALWSEIADRRAANMRRFVADIAAVATLGVDPGHAADIVWATNAPELYQLMGPPAPIQPGGRVQAGSHEDRPALGAEQRQRRHQAARPYEPLPLSAPGIPQGSNQSGVVAFPGVR